MVNFKSWSNKALFNMLEDLVKFNPRVKEYINTLPEYIELRRRGLVD